MAGSATIASHFLKDAFECLTFSCCVRQDVAEDVHVGLAGIVEHCLLRLFEPFDMELKVRLQDFGLGHIEKHRFPLYHMHGKGGRRVTRFGV